MTPVCTTRAQQHARCTRRTHDWKKPPLSTKPTYHARRSDTASSRVSPSHIAVAVAAPPRRKPVLAAGCAASFTTLMSTSQAEAFGHALNFDFEALQDALASVEVQAAESSTRKDKEMILDAVARSIGHERFNLLVGKLLAGAMADEASAVVGKLSGKERSATVVHHAALLLHEASDLVRAADLYAEALDNYRTTLGSDHPEFRKSMITSFAPSDILFFIDARELHRYTISGLLFHRNFRHDLWLNLTS